MILQEMFWKIIRVCLERYSDNLANVLVGGILTSEERIREVMNLVEQNLDEETMLKKLREIRSRDNLPMRQILLRWKERLDYSEKFRG